MKKLLLVLFIVPFLFCGCTDKAVKESPQINLNFTAEAQIKYNEKSFSANISNRPDGEMIFTINSPNELKGLSYTYKSSSLIIEYNKLKCETKNTYLPNQSLAQLLYTVLTSLNESTNYSFKKYSDGNAMFVCSCDGLNYEITVNKDTGEIKKIATDNGILTIELATVKQ